MKIPNKIEIQQIALNHSSDISTKDFYNSNRKAPEISVLSSGKIDKYEYLTGEEILPSEQEKLRIYWSSFRKNFWKTSKTNWRSRRKQKKAIPNQGQVKTIKNYTYDNENTSLISKQKEIFNKLVDERFEEIFDLDKKVDIQII